MRRTCKSWSNVSAAVLTAACVAGTTLATHAQTPSRIRALTLPEGRTAGLSSRFWTHALTNGGRLPDHERLLVLASNGEVLDVVDGDTDHVLIPPSLDRMLCGGSARVTLVHNHPANVSLSGGDLFQLTKAGIERVVAVAHDGTVYEASSRSTPAALARAIANYPRLLERLIAEARHEARLTDQDLSPLFPLLPHMAALALQRTEVIDYQARTSLDMRLTLDRYRTIIDRIVERVSGS